MVKFISVTLMVLIPLLFGLIMVPVLGFFDKTGKGKK